MGGNDLVSYLVEQLKAGYDENTLRQHLVSLGYHSFDIDPAMEIAKNKIFGLSQYVRTYYDKGYSQTQIRDFLSELGYGRTDIDNAFMMAGLSQKSHINIPIYLVFMVAGLILAGGIGYFAYELMSSPDDVKSTPKQLDVSITVVTSSVEPGNDLMYKVSLTNFGTFRGYDVTLIHKITDNNGDLIDQIQETRYIESTLSFVNEISMPDDLQTGQYFITVEAIYDNYTSVAKKLFRVVSSLEDVRNETVEIEIIEDNTSQNDKVADTGAFADLTRTEIESQIRILSKTEPETGAKACAGIVNENLKSSCFIMLARYSLDQVYCKQVDDSSKDSCYITVAMNSTDASVCSDISQEQVKNSCLALVDVNINKDKLYSRRR